MRLGNNPSWKYPVVFRHHHLIFGPGNVVSLPLACDKSLTTPRCYGTLSSCWGCLRPWTLRAPTGRDWLLSLLAGADSSALDTWALSGRVGEGSPIATEAAAAEEPSSEVPAAAELETLCQFLSAEEDAPDSAEKFPRKSECLQSGDQPAELHDGRTRAAPSHRGRTSRGSSWHAPAPRTFPMSPEDFSATAAVGTAWPPVQTLKDAPGTRRDRTGEQNSPSKTVIPVPPREGSGPQRWDPHSCGASLLKKNQECGAAGLAYQTAGLLKSQQ